MKKFGVFLAHRDPDAFVQAVALAHEGEVADGAGRFVSVVVEAHRVRSRTRR
ncbi:MAG: hypothetical protein OXI15_16765 [Chromatiales bacterium]|nr:hypothetical protein [Chromatiales bacterium]